MKKSRYTESQIIKILKEVEGGRLVKEVCREYEISDGTYYNWKTKYGGMEASDIKRLKELEDENRRLKQMYAELQRILRDEGGDIVPVFANAVLARNDKVAHGELSALAALDHRRIIERWWMV